MNRNIAVVLSGRDAGLARTLGAASQTIDAFGRKMETAGTRSQKMATAARLAFSALAVAAVIAFGAAVVAAVRFEVEMQNVETVAHAGRNGIRDMGDAVLTLATQLPQTTTTLARGLYDIASSGFQGAAALNILEVSATAASAGLSTTAVASKAVVAVLNAYGLEASEAQDVSDILFQTVELGVLTFEDLATQLGDVIGAAAAAGIEFDEVGSAIATMTLAGLSAAESTVSLNRLIQKLINPGEALAAAFRKLGFESGAAALEQEGLFGTMELLRQATGGQITELIRLFPEIRAARGAYALMAASGTHYARVQAIITDEQGRAGATQRAFNTQMEAVGNQFRVLTNRVQVFGIRVGTALLPVLLSAMGTAEQFGVRIGDAFNRAKELAEPAIRSVADAIEDVLEFMEVLGRTVSPVARALGTLAAATVVAGIITLAEGLELLASFLTDHPGLVRAVAVAYGGILAGRLLIAAAAFIRLHAGLLLVRAGLAALTAQAVVTRLALIVTALGTLLSGNFVGGAIALRAAVQGLGIALAGLAPFAAGIVVVAGLYAIQTGLDNANAKARALVQTINEDIEPGNLQSINEALERNQEAWATAYEEARGYSGVSGIVRGTIEILTPLENKLLDSSEATQQLAENAELLQSRFANLSASIGKIMTTFGISEAAAKSLARQLELTGELDPFDPEDWAPIEEELRNILNIAEHARPATEAFIGALESVSDPAATASDRVAALNDAIEALIGTMMGVSNATIGWEQAVDDLTDAVAENGLTLDLNTQEGRNVATAINDAAEAALDHANAVAEQSGSIADGVAVLQLHREQLVGQLQDLGLTREAAEQYVNQLGLTPENISTLVDLQNAESAMVSIEQFQYMLELVDRAESTAEVNIDSSKFDNDFVKIAQALIQIEMAAPEAEVFLDGSRFTPTAEMVQAWAAMWDDSSPEAEALLDIIDPQNNFNTLSQAAVNWDNTNPQATARLNINPAILSFETAEARRNRWNVSSGTADLYAADHASGVMSAVQNMLRNLDSMSARVDIYGVYHPPPNAPGGGGFRIQRHGGLVAAQQGLLQAGVVNMPTVLFGERTTGGEAFIPRFGNANRSRTVLATAASWYGLELRPRGQGGSRGMMIDARTTVQVSVRATNITDQKGLVGTIRGVIGRELEEHDRKLARELASR